MRAQVDGYAVAELGAQLERLLAARDVMELDRRAALSAALVDVRAEALQEAASRQEGELQLTEGTIILNEGNGNLLVTHKYLLTDFRPYLVEEIAYVVDLYREVTWYV